MPPFFTILVPVYNHEKFVGIALDSLLAQTDPDWEACVVDDGSTDGTPAILDDYARRDPRIRVFHKPNGGTASALNHALQQARGEWICWLSSDDLFLPDKLTVHRDWIVRHQSCLYFFTDFQTLDNATGQIGPPYTDFVPDPRWQVLDLLALNYVNGITICVHRSLFEEGGGFNSSGGYGQDFDLHLRFLSLGRAVRIPQPTCLSRIHPAQGGRMDNSRMMFDCALAAVRFLNRTPFETMLPGFAWDERCQARALVEHAVDVAAGSHGYLYQAGMHPALVMRVMEWLWAPGADRRIGLKRLFAIRARALSATLAGSPAGAIWKSAAILAEYDPPSCPYSKVAPLDVLKGGRALAQASGDMALVEKFDAYGRRFLGGDVQFPAPSPQPSPLKGEGVLARVGFGVPGWTWADGENEVRLPAGWRSRLAIASVSGGDAAISGEHAPWVVGWRRRLLREVGRVGRGLRLFR